ncbi:unnamed protein product [Brassica rapa]|uniref:Neprosin PEP catalytic domain-containing protein n=1 Tax=Brassica campestris TaxID=3711 RepID=A0A8D9G5Z2_BRACM|nr:unnamed protein product [Brassica rapa]
MIIFSCLTPFLLSLQDYPSGMTKTEEGGFGWQVWHRNGTACPQGTVPVQRVEAEAELSQGKYGPLIPDAAERATKGHQASYAVGFVEADLPIYGTKATLNVWNPVVESGDDFSLAQIWVTSGNYKHNDLNTLETGWQVYPNKYGDRQARLFTYWTIDAYISSGCYNHYCKGFVHVNRHVVLGGAITGTSTFGGDQFDITLQIWKDPLSGHWWLGMGLNVVPIGYWPVELFTTLSAHASKVQWGGEVLYINSTGLSNITQMGSGAFPRKGFRKAAYVCNMQIAEKNRSFLPPLDFQLGATQPDSYTAAKTHGRGPSGYGNHFYYGGPGPLRSSSFRSDPLAILFLFLGVYVVV